MAKDKQGLWSSLADLVGQAVESVRHEVVERGWFGREVTGPGDADPVSQSHENPDIKYHAPSFEELWAPRETPATVEQKQDHGIDR